MKVKANLVALAAERSYETLLEDFARRYPQHVEDLEQVMFSWPILPTLFQRAAFLLSPYFPSGVQSDTPALVHALFAGTQASLRLPGMDAYGPFIKAAMSVLSESVAATQVYGVTTTGDVAKWELCLENLCLWSASYDSIIFSQSQVSSSSLQAATWMTWARLLTLNEIALLFEDERSDQRQLPLSLPDSISRSLANILGNSTHQ